MKITNDVGQSLTPERLKQITALFTAYEDGFFTTAELNQRLHNHQIQGTWSNTNWTGYDYQSQGWIVVTP